MKAETIVVTPRSLSGEGGAEELAPLREKGYELVFPAPGAMPSVEQLKEPLRDAVGYLAGVEPIPRELLEGAPRLKAISRNGTGMDNIDLAAAKERGIAVLRAAGANAQGVAELTIGLLFSLLRGIPQSDAALKRGEWRRQKGVEAAGLTLGVIGCGNIGQLVTRMALTIGMAVRAYDPYPDTNFAPGADPDVADFAFAAYEEVITSADVLTLHCPPAPDGTPLIDGDILSRARDGVYLINTARAELLDTEAVRAALDDGRLARVALDTVERVEPGHPLATHERVIGTPHIGGYTRESGVRAARAAVTNLLAHLTGQPHG